MKYYIRTYGCQMNVHESEKLRCQLADIGLNETETDRNADIIIFNTCCIRNTAEQKIISHIGETKHTNQIICVVGCLSQRESSATALRKKFPHIAIILGTHNIGRLAAILKSYISTRNEQADARQINKKQLTEILPSLTDKDKLAITRSRENTAYINITYGCENFCSYCIVPYVRGKLINRDSELIKQEFHARLKQNKKIIMLLGQNVNSYVCPNSGIDFPTLLETLCKEMPANSETQINFMSSHPKDFSVRLAEVIAANPRLERNIHLPLQSGCNRILALMNRGYTVAQYEAKIINLRKLIPGIRITTDIICGFPSETETDFQSTMETLKRLRFNAAFIFPYSRRTGTVADKMPDQIDAKTKKARTTKLIELQRMISNS